MRINSILIIISLFGLALVSRLFFVQIIKGDYYKAMAQGMYNSGTQETQNRGEIFFQKGESLAINMEWPLVYASPKEVKDKETAADKLSQVLNMDESSILTGLKKDNFYELIKKRLTQDEVSGIKEANLKGVYLGKETGRYYPQETLASQIVGFLDQNKVGQYGLEGYYDDILQGGNNITLTIDYSIQFMAEKLLAEASKNLKIESGQIVVLNPNSGKVLAMANFPSFNPNQYSLIKDFDVFQNSVTQKLFEPGSVFKPITMAGALEEERITPQTVYTDTGSVKIGGYPIYNYDNRVWGEKTMTEVLEKSINTGAVFAEKQLGNELFLKYIDRFGILEPSGIGLQEIYSQNKEFKKGYEINFATASFGQGIEMTPIQLAKAYCAIANSGKMVVPYIIDGSKPKTEEKQVISSKTASQLTAMLINVVEQGYAKSAQVSGYYVAGKTGTAQVPEGGKYSSDKTIQSFIGFAPAFSPQFVILVKLDNPGTKTAEYSAVPIFHDLAKYIIDYYQIPPDYEQ